MLDRFGIKDCAPGDTPIAKGEKFNINQCPKNELEQKKMQKFPYASAVESLTYLSVYVSRYYIHHWNAWQVFK